MSMIKFSGVRLGDGRLVIGDLIQTSDKRGFIVTYFEKGKYLPDEDLMACKCVLHKVNMRTVKLLEVGECK